MAFEVIKSELEEKNQKYESRVRDLEFREANLLAEIAELEDLRDNYETNLS
jgi:DNA repair exonuclease SbcCD ATPase subunit